jgi:23S rRNA pseudouridine2605 synthase
MKLQLFISHNGGVSRRKAFDHVLAGDVTVNGLAVREPSHMVEPTEDKVVLQGREIKPKPYEYIMLNKPAGIVTTCEAQFDQRAVISLLPPNMRHLKPVGRLDKDTEGLLLLTNDGEMANRLSHPSFDVNKTYHVRVSRQMEFREKNRLEQGVVIDKFKTAPAEVTNMKFSGGFTDFDLTIHEGHKRQVRLMCHEVGHDVVHLTRIAQGPLKLEALKVGAMRPLTGEEIALLHAIARPETGRSPLRIGPKPIFQSNSTERRFSANRDWHSDKSTRRILSGSTGAPRRDDKPRAEGAPRREYKSYSSERPSSDRPRTEGYVRRDDRPRTESAPRREYKPYSRDARPSSDRPRTEGYVRRDDKPRTGSYVRRDDKPRTEGAPRREYKPYSRDTRPSSDRSRTGSYVRRDDKPRTEGAPRREYKPYSKDARPSSDRPRTGSYVRRDDKPRTEAAPRREYKPYSRDARPSSDRPRSERPSSGKTFTSSSKPYKKPFGKKTFRKSV